MQSLRFILALAEMLLSPAILLYILAAPKAMPFRSRSHFRRDYPPVHAA